MGSRSLDIQQLDAEFADRVRAVRKATGMTLDALATRLNGTGFRISGTGLSKLEHGDRRCSIGEAAIIADALNVSLVDMLSAGPIKVTVTVID